MEIFIILVFLISQVTYDWPISPRPEGKLINSTFGEYRGPNNPHFHEGIDIPRGQDPDAKVWSLSYTFQVVTWDQINGVAEVLHYYDDTSAALSEGSRYIHLNPATMNSLIYENNIYSWFDTLGNEYWLADGHNLGGNPPHLHLELREPFNLVNSVNPFSISELRIKDYNSPIIHSVYVDYSLYGSAEVENWNFLGGNFSSYYSTVSGGGYTFVRLTLPSETPYNDWDDPHIILSGNLKTKFTVKA
ncbi:MAG: hypothetical protein ABIM29_03580 [candidate division WOR-3 bacterium]